MYDYKTERESVFTEEGQVMFLKIRDNINRLLKEAGAVRLTEAIKGCIGDSWQMLACVDRLIELNEIIEISDQNTMGQFRVFIRSYK